MLISSDLSDRNLDGGTIQIANSNIQSCFSIQAIYKFIRFEF